MGKREEAAELRALATSNRAQARAIREHFPTPKEMEQISGYDPEYKNIYHAKMGEAKEYDRLAREQERTAATLEQEADELDARFLAGPNDQGLHDLRGAFRAPRRSNHCAIIVLMLILLAIALGSFFIIVALP